MPAFRLASLFFMLLCLMPYAGALAEPAALRGYDAGQTPHYQYVTFGTYPYEKDGENAPVLWRVLGRGTPGEGDVINASNVPDTKEPNGDDLTGSMEDVYCLMTEYIIDFVLYHDVRDEAGGTPLDYADTLIRVYLNEELLGRMFTKSEQATLVEMPERGLLSLPSRKGELFRADYGFVAEDFVALRERRAVGTPYAYALGLKRIEGNSWYWTTDWRAAGRRWIVGDNGHISVSGLDRQGGVRPICYVHADMLEFLGGDGTPENPYHLGAAQ